MASIHSEKCAHKDYQIGDSAGQKLLGRQVFRVVTMQSAGYPPGHILIGQLLWEPHTTAGYQLSSLASVSGNIGCWINIPTGSDLAYKYKASKSKGVKTSEQVMHIKPATVAQFVW